MTPRTCKRRHHHHGIHAHRGESRLSRRGGRPRPMPKPRLKTHPSPGNRQMSAVNPEPVPESAPVIESTSAPAPRLGPPRPQHRPSLRTSPSISQPRSSAPARFCTSCRPISPYGAGTRSASSASTTGSPASAVPSRPRETAQASPALHAGRRAPRSHRAHPPTPPVASDPPGLSIKSKNPSSNDKRLKSKSGFEPFLFVDVA